eukprot:12199321-Alexandrium_andersonii.AAC.1
MLHVLSWNVCGRITEQDGAEFMPALCAEAGVALDAVLLQECGKPELHVDLLGFEAFGDGAQRGNAVLLRATLAREVLAVVQRPAAIAVAIQGSALTEEGASFGTSSSPRTCRPCLGRRRVL